MKLLLPSITSFCEENLFQNKISFSKARRSSTGREHCAAQGCTRTGKHMMKVCMGATKGEAAKRRSQTRQKEPFFESEVRQYCRGYNREIHCRKSTWKESLSRRESVGICASLSQSFSLFLSSPRDLYLTIERRREATGDRATYAGSRALLPLPPPLPHNGRCRKPPQPRAPQNAAEAATDCFPRGNSRFPFDPVLCRLAPPAPGALLLVSLTF